MALELYKPFDDDVILRHALSQINLKL